MLAHKKKKLFVACGYLVLLLGSTAQAGTSPYLLAADFEEGFSGWLPWIGQGVGQIFPGTETPPLGTGASQNNVLMNVIGNSPDFLGGLFTIVPTPINRPMQLDGFWRTTGPNIVSAAVYDFDGFNLPMGGVPFFPPPAYQAGGAAGSVDGIMFDTANMIQNPMAGSLGPGSPTGQVVVLISSQGPGRLQLDDVWLQLTPPPPNPDFDNNGILNCLDVDSLVGTIASGNNLPPFDLNFDGIVNRLDLDLWLSLAGEVNLGPGESYQYGDASLDGFVDELDFRIWFENRFINLAAWCVGDFDASGSIDGTDFGFWNANKFTTSSTPAVPEPALVGSVGLLGLGIALCLRLRLVMRR